MIIEASCLAPCQGGSGSARFGVRKSRPPMGVAPSTGRSTRRPARTGNRTVLLPMPFGSNAKSERNTRRMKTMRFPRCGKMQGRAIIALMGAVFLPLLSEVLSIVIYSLLQSATTLPAILHQVFIRRVPIMMFVIKPVTRIRNIAMLSWRRMRTWHVRKFRRIIYTKSQKQMITGLPMLRMRVLVKNVKKLQKLSGLC